VPAPLPAACASSSYKYSGATPRRSARGS
jgi:hypothetical protein